MLRLLKAKSLKFWISMCLVLALLPLSISAVGGYILLNRGVIASYQDIAERQRAKVAATQELRLLLWNSLVPVDEHLGARATGDIEDYRTFRVRIESHFAALEKSLARDPDEQQLVKRAKTAWTEADLIATSILSVTNVGGRTGQSLRQFHITMATVEDRLAAVLEQIDGDVQADRHRADLFYERSLWLAGIAAAVSLLTIIASVYMLGRIIAKSVDRLVDGANRFAEGDRNHRIEISVPPELHKVAEEFNYMIGRIHDSESTLAELARVDGLTSLANRRAFDEKLLEHWENAQRRGRHFSLLTFDIDHFKQINDRYGHATGDEVLKAVARNVQKTLRPGDGVFRIGGEEFAAILPALPKSDARDMAERIREAASQTVVHLKNKEIRCTISVGIAFSQSAPDPDTLLEMSDAALYAAKTAGRNRIAMDESAEGKADEPAAQIGGR